MAKTTPQALADRERQSYALQLRQQGLTWQQVADKAGYSSRHAAHTGVSRLLDRVEAEHVDDYRAEELLHIGNAQGETMRNLERSIDAGDLAATNGAIRLLIQISERRSKLLGLNAPDRIEVGAPDADLEAVIARATALMDGTVLRVGT